MTADRRTLLVVMSAGYFLVLLDVTVVNVALPDIGRSLGAGVGGLQWVVDAYAVALAALMLAGGVAGDVHGHRRIVVAGMSVFAAASLGCGLAPGVGVLVAARAVQGAGAALMLPGTLAVVSHAHPGEDERAQAIGIWAAVGSGALAAGPLVGGALTELAGWRAVFLVDVPVAAAAAVAAARLVEETHADRSRRLDVPGLLLAAGGLGTLTVAIVAAGRTGVTVAVAGLAGAALLLGRAFLAVERSRRDPLLPLALFRDARFATANAVAGTMNLATLGVLFVVTLDLQRVRGDSALAAGATLLALFVPVAGAAIAGGRLTARAGPRRPMVAGLLIAATGLAGLAVAGPAAAFGPLLVALLLWGTGIGVLTPSVVAAAVGSVAAARSGLASAVNNTARQAGGAVGIALFGAVAGDPGSDRFRTGFVVAAGVAAALYVAAAVATRLRVPDGRPDRAAA